MQHLLSVVKITYFLSGKESAAHISNRFPRPYNSPIAPAREFEKHMIRVGVDYGRPFRFEIIQAGGANKWG
jgi:hypothetical protein